MIICQDRLGINLQGTQRERRFSREKYSSVREYGTQTPILRLDQIATLYEGAGVWRLDETMGRDDQHA
jgi:hypothetical protein